MRFNFNYFKQWFSAIVRSWSFLCVLRLSTSQINKNSVLSLERMHVKHLLTTSPPGFKGILLNVAMYQTEWQIPMCNYYISVLSMDFVLRVFLFELYLPQCLVHTTQDKVRTPFSSHTLDPQENYCELSIPLWINNIEYLLKCEPLKFFPKLHSPNKLLNVWWTPMIKWHGCVQFKK